MKNNIPEITFYFVISFSALFLFISRSSINDYPSPSPMLNENKTENFLYNIDYCNVEPRFSIIAGWAGLIDGGIDVITNVYVVDSNNNLHRIKKTTTIRNDIAKKNNNPAFIHSGFIASIANRSSYNITNKFVLEILKNGKRSVAHYECK